MKREFTKENIMNFNEFKYEPVDISQVKSELGALVDEFKNAKSAKEQIRLVQEINDYRSHVDTMFQLCNVRFTINTLDKYYLIKQRICNNCKNVFDKNRKINVVFLQTMIMDTIYENYEVDFTIIDIEKLSKNEPSKLIFAINALLNKEERYELLTYQSKAQISAVQKIYQV